MIAEFGIEWIVVGVLLLIELALVGSVMATKAGFVRRMTDELEVIEKVRERTSALTTATDKLALLDDTIGNGALSECWGSLKTLARFPAPDFEPVWRVARGQYDATLQKLRSTPNQALLWGLLGTVASLVWAFWDMGRTLQSGSSAPDPSALAHAITPHLTRFRVAFISTGIGVLSAIVAAAVSVRTHQSVDRHLEEVESFLLHTCAPVAIPPSMEHSLERIQAALEKANTLAGETATHMKMAALQIARQVAYMRETTTRAIDSYQAISTEIQEGASRLRDNVTELGNVQKSVQEGYADLQRTVQERHEQLFKQQANTLAVFLETAKKVQGLLVNHTNQTLQAFSTAGERFDRACDRFTDASAEFREMSKLIGFEAYNKLEEWSSRFHESLKAQEENLELIDSRLLEVAASVRDMMERMNPQLLHSDDWARVRAVLDNGVAASDLYIASANQIRDQLTAQREKFDQTCGAFLETLRSVTALPQTVAHASSDLVANIVRHGASLEVTAARMESLGLLLERIERSGDGLRSGKVPPLPESGTRPVVVSSRSVADDHMAAVTGDTEVSRTPPVGPQVSREASSDDLSAEGSEQAGASFPLIRGERSSTGDQSDG